MKDIPNLEFLSKLFPLSHDHKDKRIMTEKIKRHIEPTLDLNEMETPNMAKILEILSMRHLELLSQRLSGAEQREYETALFDMRSNSVSMNRVKEAEAVVMKTAARFGKALIFGDQLTV